MTCTLYMLLQYHGNTLTSGSHVNLATSFNNIPRINSSHIFSLKLRPMISSNGPLPISRVSSNNSVLAPSAPTRNVRKWNTTCDDSIAIVTEDNINLCIRDKGWSFVANPYNLFQHHPYSINFVNTKMIDHGGRWISVGIEEESRTCSNKIIP